MNFSVLDYLTCFPVSNNIIEIDQNYYLQKVSQNIIYNYDNTTIIEIEPFDLENIIIIKDNPPLYAERSSISLNKKNRGEIVYTYKKEAKNKYIELVSKEEKLY